MSYRRNNILISLNFVFDKLKKFKWSLIVVIILIASYGILLLYSASGGNWEPWASRQFFRLCFGLFILICFSFINVYWWLRASYILYILSLLLLLIVDIKGYVGMGAKRWINLGFFSLQPSEILKITMVLAISRYYQGISFIEIKKIKNLFVPILIILIPIFLVLRQPDLGTALLLLISGGFMLFVSCIGLTTIIFIIIFFFTSLPFLWYLLHDYQKDRILIFLNPERDPMGIGYHILQSKIALGSGGLFGNGWLQGSQNKLNFLPEKQTDFIFSVLGEEFGFIGTIILILLYLYLILNCYNIAFGLKSTFSRLVIIGFVSVIFLYVFINMAMVMGLVPIVGLPLPLVSYGGTSMITILIELGIIQSINIYRNDKINRAYRLGDIK